jgi:hypothetical protein
MEIFLVKVFTEGKKVVGNAFLPLHYLDNVRLTAEFTESAEDSGLAG